MTTPDIARLTRKEALRLLALAGGAALAPGLVLRAAAEESMGHDAMGGMKMAAPGAAPSTQAYMDAAAKMHAAMDIEYTGDADVDFVRGMIAHHQGAIDMATVVIEYGKDPDIRTLAEGIVAAQTDEIALMQKWLAAHGG